MQIKIDLHGFLLGDYRSQFPQVCKQRRLLVQSVQLVDAAASQIERVGGNHHIFNGGDGIGHIVAIVLPVYDDDRDGGTSYESP